MKYYLVTPNHLITQLIKLQIDILNLNTSFRHCKINSDYFWIRVHNINVDIHHDNYHDQGKMGPSNKKYTLFCKRYLLWYYNSVKNKNMLKIQIKGMLLISYIKIIENTLISWISATWMLMVALKMHFQASITNNEKWAMPKLFIA